MSLEMSPCHLASALEPPSKSSESETYPPPSSSVRIWLKTRDKNVIDDAQGSTNTNRPETLPFASQPICAFVVRFPHSDGKT